MSARGVSAAAVGMVAAVVVAGSAGVALADPAAPTRGGRVGEHGMVIFGDAATGLVVSHIPMFRAPHDMQVVLRVRVIDSTKPLPVLAGAWTFVPAKCSLDDIVLGALTTLHGTLYRGNFESGGQPILDANLAIERIVVAAPLGDRAPPKQLAYRAIGTRGHVYLYHPISHAPDFDQLLAVDINGAELDDDALRAGVDLRFDDGADDVRDRLRVGAKRRATLADGRAVTIVVRDEFSDLVGPMFDAPPTTTPARTPVPALAPAR